MQELIEELKSKIVDALMLEDVEPAEIEDDAPLFGEGLELDSIDALELVVMFEKDYGIVLEDREMGKEVFQSVRTMAEYVSKNRQDP